MSFECNKCHKKMKRKFHLERHLFESKYPCDLRCRECEFVYETKKLFRQHLPKCEEQKRGRALVREQQLQLAQLQPEEEEEEQQLQPVQVASQLQMLPIPFQDFDVEVLKYARVISCQPDGEEVVENIALDGGDGELRLRQIRTGDYRVRVEIIEDLIIRAKNASATASPRIMYNTLNSLERGAPLDKIRYIATNMINDVLRQEDDPRLHGICMSDVNRGTVRALQRLPAEPDKTSWMTHDKRTGMTLLNNYTRELFAFFLEAGTHSLTRMRYKNLECAGLEGAHDWSILLFEYKSVLEVERMPNDRVVHLPGPIPERLQRLIEERKEEVFEKIKRIIVNDKDLEQCLKASRQFTHPTMKRAMKRSRVGN